MNNKENTEYKMLYKRTYSYLKPYQLRFWLCNLLSGAGLFALFSSVGVLLRNILQITTSQADQSTLSNIVIYLLIIAVLAVLTGFAMIVFDDTEYKIQNKLRTEMMKGYLKADEKAIENISQDEVLNRINYDLPKATQLIGSSISGWVYQPIVSGALSVVLLLLVDWRIALLCVGCALLVLCSAGMFADQISAGNQKLSEEKSDAVGTVQEGIDGMREVRIFHIQKRMMQQLSGKLKKVVQTNNRAKTLRSIRYTTVGFTANCFTMISLLAAGSYLAGKEYIEFADIMLAVPLSDQIAQMIVALGTYRNMQKELTGNEKRVYEIIDLPSSVRKTYSYLPVDSKDAAAFENVSFSYGEREVLHDISFAIPKNRITALIGESGSGKSTILKLLLGLHHPDSGNVLIHPDMQFAYMPQSSTLLHASIAENIALSRKYDRFKVQQCAQQAYADSFIQQKEKGYQFIVDGDNGSFSGGQNQRIAMAKTLYQDKDIIIFDEPTSALDPESTEAIIQTIQNLKWKTILLITHNMSLASNADMIYRLKDGKVLPEIVLSQKLVLPIIKNTSTS